MADRSEEAKFSSLRVTRPAIATETLVKFLKKMETVVLDLYGPDDATVIYERETLEQQLTPGKGRSRRGVDITDAQIYAANAVKLSLFERRAPVTSGLTRSFSRAKDWAIAPMHPRPKEPGNPKSGRVENPFYSELLEAAIDFEVDDLNEITVTAVGIVPSINPDYDYRGKEYALVLDAAELEAQYLDEEAGIVYRAIKGLKNSNNVMYPTGRSAPHIPILRLPYRANPRVTSEFLNTVRDDYLPIELKLGPQDWGGNDTVSI